MNYILTVLSLAALTGLLQAACQNECHWNGRCVSNKCRCYEGFRGATCNVDCGCEGHGVCASDTVCHCEHGWKWDATQGKCVWDCQCDNGESCIGPSECGCSVKCQYGRCRNGQCICWEGYKGKSCDTYDKNIMMNKDVSVGMNVGGISYYSSEVKFVDIHKQSQSWITERDGQHTWDTHEQNKLHLRSDGYPASLEPGLKVLQLMERGFAQHEEQGNFTVLYDGEGVLEFSLTHYKILYEGKGRIIVNMDHIGKGGFILTIHKTNPQNPVRNVRVLIPGYEYHHDRFPFHPIFLESLKRYSELRFMDFIHTNNHQPEPTTWANRRKSDHYTQAGSEGAAIEYMIELANTLGANPWFNMPHAADDNYVRKFAQLVKSSLRPDLTVYLEYSNEVWNSLFRQTKYSKDEGVRLNLDPKDWKAGMFFYGRRASEIVDIWNQVYGSDKHKLYPIFAWQTGYQDYYRQAVAAVGNNIKKFKALALTGYFNCDSAAGKHASQLVSMSMQDIQNLCAKDVPALEKSLHYYLNMSKAHGLELIMYEGGPAVMENGAFHGHSQQAVTDKAIAFNKDSHVEKPTLDIMETWFKLVNPGSSYPGGIFNYFSYTTSPSKYGSWGMFEYTGVDPKSVPKYRAVQRFINNHFGKNPLGPKCSFVRSKHLAYGCFQQNGLFQCGQSDNNGQTWNSFPTLHQTNGEYMVLDGYSPDTFMVYIRLVDKIGSNTYHAYDTRHHSWKTMTNFQYYEAVAAPVVRPRFPNGVYDGLDKHATCT